MTDQFSTLVMTLDSGDVTIRLRPDLAPGHVERIATLANEGFYDGVVFHRVIAGFMAQGGDPTGRGTGGSSLPNLTAEFSREPHVRGVCSMARTSDPNSANSQFFIMFAPAPSLDGQYTIWGKVIEGMDVVDKIKRGQGPNGMARDPDRIKTARIGAAAAPAAEGVDSTPAADA